MQGEILLLTTINQRISPYFTKRKNQTEAFKERESTNLFFKKGKRRTLGN